MERKQIFNSSISVGSYREFIDSIFLLVKRKVPSYVCFANVHMLIEAATNVSFQRVVNDANLVAPDGKPLSLFLRFFRNIRQERICGMDILPDILRQAEALQKSVYFYGSTNELLSEIVQKAELDFPSLVIAGYQSPPFTDALSETELIIALKKINLTKPDLVLIALGCPKQEKWMAANKDKLNTCMLGLGQAFNVYCGREKRLPVWMRNLSLEWAYRLYLEPRRLWKRYVYTNSYFLFLVFKYFMRNTYSSIREKFLHKSKVSPS